MCVCGLRLQVAIGVILCRHVRALQAHSKEDEIVVDNLLGEKQDFLEKALLNYILCLKAGVRMCVYTAGSD